MLTLILLVFAFVLFAIPAIFSAAEPYWHRLVAAGLAFWVLSAIVVGRGL